MRKDRRPVRDEAAHLYNLLHKEGYYLLSNRDDRLGMKQRTYINDLLPTKLNKLNNVLN
jgi:hypothetical protein